MGARRTGKGAVVKSEIFVVEDQDAVRRTMVELLNREAGLSVCGAADDADPALAAIQQGRPDVALVDMRLKSSSGIELIRELRRLYPALIIVGMTMLDPVAYERQARTAGANQFIVKQSGMPAIIDTIHRLLAEKEFGPETNPPKEDGL